MIDKEILGKYIARKRKETSLTQTDLANKLNISFQAISKWERGLTSPDKETLEKLCEILGIKEGWYTFEAASKYTFGELIKNINTNGITHDNYISLAALLLTEKFQKKHTELIFDSNIRTAIKNMLSFRDDWMSKSIISVSHLFSKEYASLIDNDFIISNLTKINDTYACTIRTDYSYPYFVMNKIMQRVTDDYHPSALIVVNQSEDIQFNIVCSNDLVLKGFNCMYFRNILETAIFMKNVIPSSSGGGNENHAVIGIPSNMSSSLREDALTVAKDLLCKYIKSYDKDIQISFINK